MDQRFKRKNWNCMRKHGRAFLLKFLAWKSLFKRNLKHRSCKVRFTNLTT